MTTSDFIALATGAVTLVGVVLVFGQLRSLNQQSRMQTFAEYTRRYQEIALLERVKLVLLLFMALCPR